jgi:hypothetical protein
MNIAINFDNFNDGTEEGVYIYRATAPIPDNALPAPLATLPPGAKQYIDTTAVRGTKYYYRFGVFKGTDVLASPNKTILAVAPEDTGPGPKVITMGDWDLGFFGYCPSADFISYGTLTGLLGVTAGTASFEYGWWKVAYKGKVLFVARSGIRHSLTYNDVYAAGAVFGTNDNGVVVPTGATPVNQYRPLTVGEFTVIPRLLKGSSEGKAFPASVLYPTAKIDSNEYDDILGRFALSGAFVADPAACAFGRADWMMVTAPHSNSRAEFTASLAGWTAASCLLRGLGKNTMAWQVPARAAGAVNTADFGSMAYPGLQVYGFTTAWRPVLELAM